MYMGKKYIVHIGICGFGNQLLGFKELSIIAKYTNRTMIAPIFIPHGTIRNQCKAYYDLFDLVFAQVQKSLHGGMSTIQKGSGKCLTLI